MSCFHHACLALGLSLGSLSSARSATTSNFAYPDTGWPGDLLTNTVYLASSFTTVGSGAYSLSSITVGMGTAVTPEGGFALQVWSQSSSSPGTMIAQLVGETNPSAGNFTYTPMTTVTLNANTTYWVVAKVTAGSNGEYRWLAAANGNQTGDWTIGNNIRVSGNSGASWSTQNVAPWLFSVSAAAVPEPGAPMLLIMGGVGAALRRRRPQRGLRMDNDSSGMCARTQGQSRTD